MAKILAYFLIIFGLPSLSFGQKINPVFWSIEVEGEGSSRTAVAKATIQEGWHLYDLSVPDGGPIATSMSIEKNKTVRPKGKVISSGHSIMAVDLAFSMELTYFKEEASFSQAFKLKGEPAFLRVELEYMLCNDEMCLPPTNKVLEYDIQ